MKYRLRLFFSIVAIGFLSYKKLTPEALGPQRSMDLLVATVDHALDAAAITAAASLLKNDGLGPKRQHMIQALQTDLNCIIDGEPGKQHHHPQRHPLLRPNPATVPGGPVSLTAARRPSRNFCALLRGRTILFAGPQQTHYLHNALLIAFDSGNSSAALCSAQHTCLGFHHVCTNEEAVGVSGRLKKPSRETLKVSGSVLVEYDRTSTLYANLSDANTPYGQDGRFHNPFIDPRTGVRSFDSNWLFKSHRADVIILGRAPVPAPASTWTDSPLGNWSFLQSPTLKNYMASIGLSTALNEAEEALHAALHVTLTQWLPELLDTLALLKADTKLSEKTILWHGNWYFSPSCLPTIGKVPALFFEGTTDLWSLYHNAQVYMQDRLLRTIIPASCAAIVYLPSLAPQSLSPSGHKPPAEPGPRARDCIRLSPASESGQAVRETFLAGLSIVLSSRDG